MRNFGRISLLALTIGCFGPLSAHAQDLLFDLGDRTEPKVQTRDLIASYAVRLNTDALKAGEPSELTLRLPDATVIARLQPASPNNLNLDREIGQAVWSGPVFEEGNEKSAGGEIFLMRRGEYLQARIAYRGRLFSLRGGAGAEAVLEEFDVNQMLDHPEGAAPPVEPPSTRIGDAQPDSSCVDPADRIDVMVVYTELAKTNAGGQAAMENEIAFGLAQANLALANSNAFHRYNLVYVDQVTYDEATNGGASTTVLGELQDTSDMVMDEVHGWRDTAKADLVSLVTADGDCGWGNTVESADADTTDHRAFTVVRRSCLNTNISLAHELGHNMGGLHNREDSGASSLTPPYNHGHRQPVPSDSANSPWRTVMAYGCDGVACTRVTQYSNPNVSFPATSGDPTGVALADPDPEHNVNVFAVNDAEVARYRCGRSDLNVANVWGKDTWADTGLEPDPATAGDPMWRSPYIWVRNAQDASLEFEHVHQNPNISADPHVYVKMLNDGNLSESGDLELYVADASTSLNTPANWSLISSQTVNFATGVEVMEFPWSSLPGTGHYCLLARWNNTGAAMSFSSIDSFVRDDGGVIWKNVNIEDLGPDEPDEEPFFVVRGVRGAEETFLRIVTERLTTDEVPWGEVVEAVLLIDPSVMPADPVMIGVEGGDGKFRVPLDEQVKFVGPLKLSVKDEVKGQMLLDARDGVLDELREKFGTTPGYRVSIQQVAADGFKDTAELKPTQPFPAKLITGGVDYVMTLAKPRK